MAAKRDMCWRQFEGRYYALRTCSAASRTASRLASDGPSSNLLYIHPSQTDVCFASVPLVERIKSSRPAKTELVL